MRIEEVLAIVDEVKPNTYDDNIKIMWLSELDGRIYHDLVLTHEQDEPKETEEEISLMDDSEEVPDSTEETEDVVEASDGFIGYTDADLGTELIAKFPHDRIYREYLFAQIDYSNGEADRYANSSVSFNSAYKDYCAWYNRTHKPIAKPFKLI